MARVRAAGGCAGRCDASSAPCRCARRSRLTATGLLLAAAWFAAYSVDTRGPDWAPADDHLLAGFSLDELLPGLR